MAVAYRLIGSATESLKRLSGLATIKTHTIYLPALGAGTIIDLGANVGEFASAMAGRGLQRFAVEAEVSVFKQIPEQVQIKKYNIAISDRDAPVQLFISENREANSTQSAISREHGIKGTATCPGMTLESFMLANEIKEVSLLKVDIEGSEEQLFDSTSDEVLRCIDQITVEFHDFIPGSITSTKVSQISERLRGLGFYCIPFSYMFPHMLNADLLFIRLKNVGFGTRACFAAIKALLNVQRAKARLGAARYRR